MWLEDIGSIGESVAAGADGLIVEVHPDPETALSDGYQSLDFDQFAQTMELCRRVAEALGRVIGSGERCLETAAPR